MEWLIFGHHFAVGAGATPPIASTEGS